MPSPVLPYDETNETNLKCKQKNFHTAAVNFETDRFIEIHKDHFMKSFVIAFVTSKYMHWYYNSTQIMLFVLFMTCLKVNECQFLTLIRLIILTHSSIRPICWIIL